MCVCNTCACVPLFLSDATSKDCITKNDKDISSRIQEKVQLKKGLGGNWKSNDDNYKKTPKSQRYLCGNTDPDLLCGVIFVDKGFTAKVIFYLLNVCVQILFIILTLFVYKFNF